MSITGIFNLTYKIYNMNEENVGRACCASEPCNAEPAICEKVNADSKSPEYKFKMRNVEITELNVGYLVRVGCQSIAFRTKDDLIATLTAYIMDPKVMEERYKSGLLFQFN
jgi:hypothetical protein